MCYSTQMLFAVMIKQSYKIMVLKDGEIMDYTISEDEMKSLAEELNLKISFGNSPEKTGIKIGEEYVPLDEVLEECFSIEEDQCNESL